MSLGHLVVRLCYAIEQSVAYRRWKGFFHDLLENPHARVRPYFDIAMALLVLSSVLLLVLAVRHPIGPWAYAFEDVALVIFIVEYVTRLWLYNDATRIVIEHYERSQFLGERFRLWSALREVVAKKWGYMTSPLAIIDLLAIIPSYRPLRLLRIFLLFRLFKLFRYARSIHDFAKVLSEKRAELATVGIFLAFSVMISATVIYIFEADAEGGHIKTFFDGIYWALVTLSTVGYGDITPQTTEGRFVTMVLILTGIGVLSFTTSIIVSAFQEKMPEVHASRIYAELEKRGRHTILCGFGRVGQVVAAQLFAARERFVVIDSDPLKVALAKKRGYMAIEGDGGHTELLENAGIRAQAERVLCLTDDDVANVYITLTARHLSPQVDIISRANREETVKKLIQAGADYTVRPFTVVGLIAAEYIGQPVAFEAIYGMLTGEQEVTLDTLAIREGSALEGRSLAELGLKARRLVLFGVISRVRREAEGVRSTYPLQDARLHFNPALDFRLRQADILVLFGHRLSVLRFKQSVERIPGRGGWKTNRKH